MILIYISFCWCFLFMIIQKRYPPRFLEVQHNYGNIGVMWLRTNTHRRMNSSNLQAQRVQQMPHKDCQHLLRIFNDHRHHPIFLEYSRVTGTILSSWNIQGSPALSHLPRTQRQNFMKTPLKYQSKAIETNVFIFYKIRWKHAGDTQWHRALVSIG